MSQAPEPVVSVVIPAYNAAAFIERTLDSVRDQTYCSFEVIVVDDGSSDGTAGVVESYLSRHGLPGRCIRQPNKKIAGARNTGMRAARGRFIALLDHDDLWFPEKLEAVMREFETHREADLVCHHEHIVKDGAVVRTLRPGPGVPDMYENLLFQGNSLSPSASVFRKDLALSLAGFRENPEFDTVEDYDFWMRFSRVGRIRFLERVLGSYQLVERAASRKVQYHHEHLLALLMDHFQAPPYSRAGFWLRWRMRRRIGRVYQSALWRLLSNREFPDLQASYAARILRTHPFDPTGLALLAMWAWRRVVSNG